MGDKMEERVVSIETQIALMQKDINNLRDRSTEFPQWLKRSAISVLGILFLQLTSTIWWAAELTTKQSQMQREITANTVFRMEFPKMHQEIMVELEKIKIQNEFVKDRLDDFKSKLKYVGKNGKEN